MKKFQKLIFFILLLAGFNASAQDIDFNVRYNGATDEYEVYARPTFTDPNYFIGGGSQISILLPAALADVTLSINNANDVGGPWLDNSQIYAPAADPAHDFHGISTNGSEVAFVNGVELRLFTFTIATLDCAADVRLFENGSDPDYTAPGMGGGDFNMFMADAFNPFTNNWRLNYFNGGLVCPDAPVVISNPITMPQGGTSTLCMPIMDLNVTDTFTATLCTGSPSNGSSIPTITGNTLCLDYTPTATFVGQDDVCIIVCDNSNLCDTVSVPVTVLPLLESIPTQLDPIVIVTPITTVEDIPVTVCTEILDHNVGDIFTATSCANTPVNGTVSISVSANILCINYIPNAGYTGSDDLCIEVCDQAGNCDMVNVPVSVIPTPVAATVPQAPILVMPPIVTPEDITHTVCGPIIDANVENTHNVTICGQAVNGVATAAVNDIDNSLCVTYDPNPNFYGTDSLCVNVCDNDGLCYELVIPIEVTPDNDPPFAIDDINTTQVDNPVSGNVLTNDFDVENDNLTVNITPMNVTNGTVVIDALGVYTFTPDPGFVGNGSFEYEVCDDGHPSKCDVALVVISVTDNTNPNNNSIVGTPDAFIMESGNTLSASVISNDYDPDGDNIAINTTPVSNPTNGVLVINADGTIDYTPNSGFLGTDNFTYQVCDDGNPQACADVVVSIEVIEDDNANDLFAVDDAASGEVNQSITGNVTDNDYDPEGGVLSVNTTPVTNVTNGNLVLNTDGTYTYTPTPGYIGNDQFVYEVCDDGTPTACDNATVYITILDSKDTPFVVTNPITVSINEMGFVCMPIYDLNSGDTFSVTPCSNSATNGIANASINNDVLCIDYLPGTGFTGTDDVCFIVCDQTGRCDTASVPVTVVPLSIASTLPEPPAVIITPITTTQDTPVDICTAIMDPNVGDTFTATFCAGTPINGVAVPTITGNTLCLSYTPNAGYVGTDDLCINVCDQNGDCDVINVPVTVVPTPIDEDVAQTPILVMPPLVTYEDVNGTACGTIIDANVSDLFTVSICGAPSNGNASAMIDNGTNGLCVFFDPNAGFIGSDEVCITVCDPGNLCYSLVVPIEVIPVNDPPMAIDDINNTQINIPVDGNVLTNDFDEEGDNLTVNVTPINPTNGTVTIDAMGEYTFVPNPGFIGNGTFEYEVCDDGNPIECDTALVTVVVIDVTNPNNNSVLGVPDNYVTEDDVTLTSDLLANDSDPDGDLLTINTTPVTNPTNGTLVINPDGTFSYVPVVGIYGVETFSYEVCDNGTPQACATVPVTITILESNGVNDLFATDDFFIGDEDETITGNLILNDNDPENGILTVNTTPVTAPVNGTLTLNPNGTFTYIPTPEFTGNDQFVYEVCDNGSPTACDVATVYITVLNVSTELRLKVMLHGALFFSPDNLMRAELVPQNLVPLNQPYDPTAQTLFATRFVHTLGGNEVTTPAVLNANLGTPDAIVDWVFVELRDATDSLTVIRTMSALLQRDGDVVNAADGGVIYVDSLPANFFAVVKHRNHLGVMTAEPVATIGNVATFDFTTATAADLYNTSGYDGLEQISYLGHQALWSGNANADNKVKYDGPGTDRNIILGNVITHPLNTSNTNNFNSAIDYYLGDINLDGKAKYDGFGNDRILIQSSVLNYPLNGSNLTNFNLFIEQIKE